MAQLTVTNRENIVINGRQQGSSRTMTFNNIVDVFTRVFSFKQQTLTTLYTTHDDTVSSGVFDDGSVKYVRITSLNAEPLVINPIGEADSSDEMNFAYELQQGQSFYLYSHNLCMRVDDGNAISSAEMNASLRDIDSVKAYCARGTGRVEVFVASSEASK
mgnify:CR=1 FL=1